LYCVISGRICWPLLLKSLLVYSLTGKLSIDFKIAIQRQTPT
jgi:hypothetical protein